MRIFDCLLYDGDAEALAFRLGELRSAVDTFVIVEATRSHAGTAKPLFLRQQWSRFTEFHRKLRYVVVAEEPPDLTSSAARARFQRDCVTRGLLDADAEDWILLSDTSGIPRADSVDGLRARSGGPVALVLPRPLSRSEEVTEAPPRDEITVATPYRKLRAAGAEAIWSGVRSGAIPVERISDAGWQVASPMTAAGLDETGAAPGEAALRPGAAPAPFPHTSAPQPADDHQPGDGRAVGSPLAWHAGSWAAGRGALRPPGDGRGAALAPVRRKQGSPRPDPVILCPYVRNEHRDRVVAAFGLDDERGRRLPFHLWQDTALIGPERAFEHCWNQFPDRDVIIVHTDMRPLPDDARNTWYERLIANVAALPDAGLIGCDLLYPVRHPSGAWYVQCAGGEIDRGIVKHIGGFVDVAAGIGTADATRYDERFAKPRRVDWVTFGGVYIRREVIDMVGGFDPGYRWAYVMDVDYSLEAASRGVNLYQVPVNLLHEENGSTRDFLNDPERLEKIAYNQRYFQAKWSDRLARLTTHRIASHASFGAQHARKVALTEILVAEAEARGAEFEVSAFIRALAAPNPAAISMTDVERAYALVLGRAADPAGLAWWEAQTAQASVPVEQLVGALHGSAEYAALTASG
ncbi:hypothetical protein [Methylobacterium planeticum]|uniref:DUF4214 domain-containing protein n=1 Tax=Methylobacterium planeticum TaxID=2615211 RepID=A0A6N6MVZ9_9HYPH|nr:hypothetical protein [Methylobacterium planeticum]KAB1075342.1 hypothetical protein F6X51_05535 [Methylobacterium planeticum]